MKKGTFEKSSGFTQVSLLALIFLFFALLCIILLRILMPLSSGMKEADVMRLTIFIQDLFIFILTPLIAQFLLWKEPTKKTLQLTVPDLPVLLWGIIAIASVSPLIDLLNTWNQGLHLPESMKSIEQWMIDSEKTAEVITNRLLNTDNWGSFTMNILIIAVMAGIGEEFMFRGVLQKILINWMRNTHLGILFAAIIFSAIHFQFFGFIPRMILGIVLGYLYVWSKSIWVPIIAHATNNALTVILTSNTFNKGNELIETVAKDQNNVRYTFVGTAIFAFSMWKIWKYYQVQAAIDEKNGS
ncbi:CPBP family intramembrane glutamic endopeptidase [uncultured Bacteroides sp.]|uniref:CPBP family intramembrane glutamic endopeptidase n=1 Tax=uncultured Bacteroides sp. TaxID=162156 RepID=UPI002AAB7830|nr:CPBP family intramembrane glutamic endopeptidase [uncultured Bacteroides sp.]